MTEAPQVPPTVRLLQFGPMVRGYRYVVVESVDEAEQRFHLVAAPVDAFGVGEWIGYDGKAMFTDAVTLFLNFGAWEIAESIPGFAGVVRDGDPLDPELLLPLDPYYKERLV